MLDGQTLAHIEVCLSQCFVCAILLTVLLDSGQQQRHGGRLAAQAPLSMYHAPLVCRCQNASFKVSRASNMSSDIAIDSATSSAYAPSPGSVQLCKVRDCDRRMHGE